MNSNGEFNNKCRIHRTHKWANYPMNPRNKNNNKQNNIQQCNNVSPKKNRKDEDNSGDEYSKYSEESNAIVDKKDKQVGSELIVSINGKAIVALLDTGSSASLLTQKIAEDNNFKLARHSRKTWRTEVGTFTTSEEAQTLLQLPQFTSKREINFKFNFSNNKKGNYDIILGRDFVLGIRLRILGDKNDIQMERDKNQHDSNELL